MRVINILFQYAPASVPSQGGWGSGGTPSMMSLPLNAAGMGGGVGGSGDGGWRVMCGIQGGPGPEGQQPAPAYPGQTYAYANSFQFQ
jgi:hypothetical protein